MRRRFFKGFSAQVNLKEDVATDEGGLNFLFIVEQEQHAAGRQSEEDEEGERPPEWLELAGDLAWTATFSSLTSNTSVTEPSAVWNYAVFFCLTWHLWATQTTYDIRYYTNDWWHRILFASQLGVYAILAAFSGSFNVSWQVDPDATDVFKGNATDLTADAMEANQEYMITKSFRGINVMLFISRTLLFAQYARATLFAAGIFLGCFLMIKEDPDSKTVAITQLIFWGVAVLSQAIAGAFTPEDGSRVLKSEGAMAPRLASLTVIILGEGLNAICATLRNSMNSLGLSKTMVGQSFSIKYSPSKILEELWLYLHFPLHLSLILLLEGIKNVFIYVNVNESFNRLSAAFDDVVTTFTATTQFPAHPRLEKLLRVLNMSWQQEANDLMLAMQKDSADPTGGSVNVDSQIWRWWGTVLHGVIMLYNDQPDPEAEYAFNQFLAANDTAIAADFNTDGAPLLSGFYNRYFLQMAYTGHWMVAVAGTLILCMAIVNVVQRRPRNRFAWGYSMNRSIIGVALIIVGGITSTWIDRENWMIWVLPTVGIGFGLAVVVDWFILFFSIRSINYMESLQRLNAPYSTVEKGDFSPGVNPTHLQYGQGPPHRSETAPVGMYAQGESVSTASLYPAETERLHQGSQYHLPYAR
ncbi:hypothetical protein FS837_011542 [Tulasnella sp. UAMH 9824]|nr:hypothetical protein FS837_011542 [Tulasnella sp. UAMH 9824]